MFGGFPERLEAHDLHLPGEKFVFSAGQSRVYASAHRLLVDTCLRYLGMAPMGDFWEGQAVAPDAGEVADVRAPNRMSRRYYLADLEQAERYGYDITNTPWYQAEQDRSAAAAAREREAYGLYPDELRAALTGSGVWGRASHEKQIPRGGCVGRAERQLGADALGGAPAGWSGAGRKVMVNSWSKSLHDPRVREAFRHWSVCMGQAGFEYATPLESNDDPRWKSAPLSLQRSAAVADVSCKRAVNVVGIWFGVEVEIQNRMIRDMETQLEKVRQINREIVIRANRVLNREVE